MESQRVPRTCVSEDGTFIVGIHQPSFTVELFRENQYIDTLGELPDGTEVLNSANFPQESVCEKSADRIYEIPNAFPFRGVTYINSAWADQKAGKCDEIKLPHRQECSVREMVTGLLKEGLKENICDDQSENKTDGEKSQAMSAEMESLKSASPTDPDADSSRLEKFIAALPYSLKLALAESSTDPKDLVAMLPLCCTVLNDANGAPCGIRFRKKRDGEPIPDISDHILYELIANNPALPDIYKCIMVLKPGIQGNSEITGEWLKDEPERSHVYEYLRRNSYIPWGHFAANNAEDTVKYSIRSLTENDMHGMRHLYYQRTYKRVAEQLGLQLADSGKTVAEESLEELRCSIMEALGKGAFLEFNGSLWGWNFGFGYAQSGYRLHASHQQIHQQYAMIPRSVPVTEGNRTIASYACGDLVADFIRDYREKTGRPFFENYIRALRTNRRVSGSESEAGSGSKSGSGLKSGTEQDLPSDLIIHEDSNVILFVPKAQTSQWELQLMTLSRCGNIVEADTKTRASLDRAILIALKALEHLGAEMVTSIEFSKRFDSRDSDQRLLYSFMPRLPESPGAFSEAQLRWINGHYPEDFAEACRRTVVQITNLNIPA